MKLARAAESLSARINRHLAEFDLTVSQFGTLEALWHLGPMHQRRLGAKILKSGGNMTMVLDNLCRRGLVERRRDRRDRRRVNIHLTPAGRELIDSIFPHHATIVEREVAILTPEEQDLLQVLCRTLGRQK